MTSSAEIDRIFDAQRRRRAGAPVPALDERVEKIRRFERAVLRARDDIRRAMWEDFGKPAQEVDLVEVYPVMAEARHARRRLRRWMSPRRVWTPLTLMGTRSQVVHEPKGVVLIISPWNFPFNLSFGPVVSALAAGNSVILKPSELTPNSSACMQRIVTSVFEEDEVAVVEGDAAVATALVAKPFDHIFFTGSAAVARKVMKAAAEHLTPVTLELGGKSPVIVEKSADIALAAKRVVFGKFVNTGQACIAPDYVLVDEAIHDAFIDAVKTAITRGAGHERSLIVNDGHATRVNRLIDSAVADGELVTGGKFEGREAGPTVVTRVPLQSAAMEEEIFGPLLPVIPYRDLGEAVGIVAARSKPLVLYIFSRNHDAVEEIMVRTSAGGTVINHTMIHFYQLNLPFGGVGESGMGRGHGFYGFESFSNARAVLEQRMRISPIEWFVPPYTRMKSKLIDWLVRYL